MKNATTAATFYDFGSNISFVQHRIGTAEARHTHFEFAATPRSQQSTPPTANPEWVIPANAAPLLQSCHYTIPSIIS